MSTILERLQERFPDRKGVNDARNIAEALAGNRGANAIADVYDGFGKSTVLYSDGLLIINELAEDRADNIAEHGEVVKEYDPWCTRQPYKFKTFADIPWLDEWESILSVKFGSPVKPTNMDYWFATLDCTSFDFEGLDTSSVTSMRGTFGGCKSLTTLDLSSFDTSNVVDMSAMFQNDTSLTTVDLSSFDTSKVIKMFTMFYNCPALTSIDVSGFDTSNVTNINSMFQNCSALTSLDVSGFDTSKVTNMSGMFRNCKVLTSIDVSGFDTSKVIGMAGMFKNCKALISLDLSSFDTSKVNTMEEMFNGSTNLETITASDAFVITGLDPEPSVKSNVKTFLNCTSLVGGNGTAYDANHVDADYARIDTEETPGYFTAASA